MKQRENYMIYLKRCCQFGDTILADQETSQSFLVDRKCYINGACETGIIFNEK